MEGVSGWSDVREEGVNWEGRGTRRGQSDEMEGRGSTAVVSLLGGSLSISRSFPVILWNDTLCRFRLFSSTWIGALYILINYFNEIFSVWFKAAVILKSSNICGTCLLNTFLNILKSVLNITFIFSTTHRTIDCNESWFITLFGA